MIVTLIGKEHLDSITLPEKRSGQYWLSNSNVSNKNFVSIEGINGEWLLKSNKNVKILNSEEKIIKNMILKPMNFYNLYTEGENEKTLIFAEPITKDRQIFKKFFVENDIDILIGRNEKNDIIFQNKFTSTTHIKLSYYKGQWSIYDKESTNGTFVNGIRVKTKKLNIGDIIYLMGLKIIIGSYFIALNNPDKQVIINTNRLINFKCQEVELLSEDNEYEYELPQVDYFFRSPRFKRDIEKALFKIDSPPQNAIGDEIPVMLVIGPSMTMGMASMATAIFAINNAITNGNITSALPSIVMSFSMLLGTVLWPILTKRIEKKRKHKKEQKRQEKYKEYLNRIEVKFNEECEKQEEILRENHVNIIDCEERIKNIQRNLWERGIGQNDFLKLRVGTGVGELLADIVYSERKFSIEDDNLQEELYTLCEKPKELKNIPITLSFFENHISGVIGDRKEIVEFSKGLIFQLAALYSYDEIKMVFIYDKDEEKDFDFVKWLPHVWNNDKNFRLIATDKNELKEVSAYIEKEIENRVHINESQIEDITPYYIVFSMSKQLSIYAEMLKKIYETKGNIQMSVITFYDDLKNLPKECSMVVELEERRGKIFDKNDISGKSTTFVSDISLESDPNNLSVLLSNVPLDALANSFNLPPMLTFLEMFGVGKVEHLNALTRWKENDPTNSLEAEVGIDTLGETFKLDLHEKFHGPHGLVAGMTGSGKSEFIITYILSLAVNYHPNEVAFILIDYKGGGMAKVFENLPHTAGIITNLDGAAIKRSLISIESELKRRQAIFAEASKKLEVSNIDIYKYQKLYREGAVSEPLQHLFIISDEFAELKTQQPEFMAQLVSAARIGRSLGVHLILATQKPSGVVDDQIWSNSKFRVCLKVQERADSMDMLKRQDAAELKETGRFYLQVGYNELFEMGQSAWAGATYYPSDKVTLEKDNSVAVIDKNGRIIRQAKVDKRKKDSSNSKKQLDVITEYLSEIAKEENIKIRPLWLEPIPAIILLDSIRKKYKADKADGKKLNPVIGEYDDPARQQQFILRLPISEEGNVVVYGTAGSGKTTFLNTMIYSLINEHTPEEVNIYIMDFSSETLKAFAKSPHVGDVVLSYEKEKISNLFKMLKSEIEKRKKMFADYGGDYASYTNTANEKIPSIVVVINNFASFTEQYEEKEEAVSFLSREGTKYGIYFVLTALSTGAVRFRLLQNFKQQIVLQLNDTTEYSTIVGKTDGLFPSKFKGRGLIKRDEIYEFQTANITSDPIPFSFIKEKCKELLDSWNKYTAKKIPILPEKVNLDFLSEYMEKVNTLNIPIGVETNSLDVCFYPFNSSYLNMILSLGDESHIFVNDLVMLISNKTDANITLIDPIKKFNGENHKEFNYVSKVKDIENIICELYETILYRNNSYKEALETEKTIEEFEQKLYFFNSIVDLEKSISESIKEKLELVLEKGEQKYNVIIIFAESAAKLSELKFTKWFKKNINPGDGIWIGNGISEQLHLKPIKTTSEMHEDIPIGFGFVLKKGKCIKVKLLNEENQEENSYE